MAVTNLEQARENAGRYYGKILGNRADLKTSACCTMDAAPAAHREILKNIDPEILERFYGCGSPIPPALEGCTVLDLGCGTGRDVYLASQLVGPSGRVIGVDMTDEQLAVARKHVNRQMARFGFRKPNVSFRKGYIEELGRLGIEEGSVDVVISNCVINLSADKKKVFSEIFRVLKPGGELYFSDVFADRRLPDGCMEDPVLHGECLGGALYYEDFRRLIGECGCLDPRRMASSTISISHEEMRAKVGLARFQSITIRAFKLASLEDRCEDYGQVVTYKGTISDSPCSFVLDDHHEFPAGKPMLVCGNTASMIQETRYAEHFNVQGSRGAHFGLFDCSPTPQASEGRSFGECC